MWHYRNPYNPRVTGTATQEQYEAMINNHGFRGFEWTHISTVKVADPIPAPPPENRMDLNAVTPPTKQPATRGKKHGRKTN